MKVNSFLALSALEVQSISEKVDVLYKSDMALRKVFNDAMEELDLTTAMEAIEQRHQIMLELEKYKARLDYINKKLRECEEMEENEEE